MNRQIIYNQKAEMLLKAIDLVYEFDKNDRKNNLTQENLDFIQHIHNHYKNIISTSKKMSDLKQIEAELFTYFNESSGEEINAFWKKIKLNNLDFKRNDILGKILKRGKIRGSIEYDFVIDTMLALFQEGIITETQYEDLSRMVGEFEKKRK